AKAITVRARLEWADGVRDWPVQLAKWLRDLEAVSVTVVWSYRRPQFLRPWRRVTWTRSRTLRIDADLYRSEIALFWHNDGYHYLSEIVEAAEQP
ncbi:MAG: hypothetical protein LC777_14310, partial [Actinobacteria bacterium]|nr:hypothetical protein [Actinomycetota bacterium]